MRPKRRTLHELPFTEIAKSDRLTDSSQVLVTWVYTIQYLDHVGLVGVGQVG